MAYTLTANYPDLPDGEELSLAGLPVTLVNGKGVDVSDDDLDAFHNHTGEKLTDRLKGDGSLKLSTRKSGGDK